jgi:putative acetyltransferase
MRVTGALNIRETGPAEREALLGIYPQAFPDEDLIPLVRDLLADGAQVLSLAAYRGDALAGHIAFTACGVGENDGSCALLAPLAVLPGYQRQGIGTALIRAGLRQLKKLGAAKVFVLGDPAYYGLTGFVPEREVELPYPMPAEWADAWQSLKVSRKVTVGPGKVALPDFWMKPELWGP